MKKTHFLFLVFGLIVLTQQLSLFGLEKLSNKTGALCLDGSQAAIYTY